MAATAATALAKTVKAWYLDDSEEDKRLAHQKFPGQFVSKEKLEKLGLSFWKFDPKSYQDDPAFEAVKKERGYGYWDVVTVSPEKLPNYDEMLVKFFVEHFHPFEEVRFALEGSGYFDVRDEEDKWIRIAFEEGDFAAMPAGACHRFTLDTKNYVKAMRLFVDGPESLHFHRPEDDHVACRQNYILRYHQKG